MKRLSPLLLLLLAGCGALQTQQNQAPAPVISSRPNQEQAQPNTTIGNESSGVVVRAYEPPAATPVQPTHGRAVTALLAEAERQDRAGQLPAAVASVERALRIEPRNPYLWNRLAELRLQQGNYSLAAELAAKSKALAAGDLPLQRENWELIAHAKRAMGDTAGAATAERKARLLR